MKSFTIAAAQLQSVQGNIEANLLTHKRYIDAAAENNVDFVIFPELSLTGYEPKLADRLKLTLDDARLDLFKKTAREHGMTIAVGVPMLSSEDVKPNIASFIFGPDTCDVYAKQYLHPGEEAYFSSGNRGCAIDVHGITIGMAICADIAHPAHAQNAAENGSMLYAAGVFITENGYNTDTTFLQQYAQRHHMAVIMANYSSSTYRLQSAGKSAIWNEKGERIAGAKGVEDALVIAKQEKDIWSGWVVKI